VQGRRPANDGAPEGRARRRNLTHFLERHRESTTMSLSRRDVEKIAHLARLQIAEEQIPGFATQLSNILAFVEQMNSARTDGVEPMAHPFDTATRTREDVVTETNERELMQSIAPAVEAGLYLVPKVIE
jgi:aspartyl-tRNA(Asn)/glutamyl-tRNA(Gln) amidotransferase subunit C